MTRYLLKVWSNQDADLPQLAVVVMDHNTVRRIFARRKMYMTWAYQDAECVSTETGQSAMSALDEARFCDHAVWFYDRLPNEGRGDDIAETTPFVKDVLEGDVEVKVLGEHDTMPDAYKARTECDRLCLDHRGVWWIAYPRHCSDQCITALIPYETLEPLLEREKP